MITLRQAIDRTLDRVSLAGGADVQTYAEAPLKEIIQHKFDVLFDGYWWDEYMTFETIELVAGIPTPDLSEKIKRFMDIKHVWRENDQKPLPRMPSNVNPTNIRGYCLAPYSSPLKVFRIYPANDMTVSIAYRTRPDNFQEDGDKILLDDQLIILGSAYDYMNSLGINPSEEDKIGNLFNERLKMFEKNRVAHGVSIGNVHSSIPLNGWMTV